MTPVEKEIIITAPKASAGDARLKLRVLKSITGMDSSTYLVPLPGVAPPGLKLSIHPFGDVHLKARDIGTVARANFSQLSRAIADGTFDKVYSSLFVTPKRRRSALAVVVPAEWSSLLTEWSGTVEFPIEKVVRAIRPVRLGDTRHLATDLRLLREAGFLRPRDLMLFADDSPDTTLSFINLVSGDQFDIPPISIPRGTPFRLTIGAVISHFRRYGGLFVRFPEGKRLDALAERLGLGRLSDGFERLATYAKETGWTARMEDQLRLAGEVFDTSLKGLSLLRPVNMKALRRRDLERRG